ncbi:glycosyltransferase family 2 protein [Lentilactobacillus sp. SPB1-3]|uniref:Glycosyltransferase family 2 protein n=1 Tax=Lentilactobacillus terminaliae TaxID=3003483 RepID=A0ACD5DDS7_9LACO|nr:glycosyltransferase family 2 protein [Lentilactobacillus sp. SPB1-3]MCZ0977629.1 glycosyltransferase family 2 protein [Lentilactobacillus sp. SPB1-3]
MNIHSNRRHYVTLTLVIMALAVVIATYLLVQPGLLGEIMLIIIKILAGMVALWTYSLIFYYMFLSIFGYKKATRNYQIHEPKLKFLILIPSHNEENVIGATIQHLHGVDYPKDLYQVVVVSDQSSDATTKIAEAEGAEVIDTSLNKHPRIGIGKPAGLQYALDDYDYKKYDYVLVIDADNFVDNNIFTELNSQLLEHHFDAVQTYLDSKNTDKFQPLGYAASYWTMNRMFQLSKYRLHLPNSIGGTGFVVSTEWLANNGGFRSHSLTEDLEMEIRIVESGGMVGWNHFTRIYDEKPESLGQSLIQRYRWSRGHWYVAFHNFSKLLIDFFKTGKLRFLDQLNYLFSMRLNVQVNVAVALVINGLIMMSVYKNNAIGIMFFKWAKVYVVPLTILNFFVVIYGFIPMIYGIMVDGHLGILKTIKAVFALMWFSLTYFISQMAGLFTFYDQTTWSHTKHVKNTINNKH